MKVMQLNETGHFVGIEEADESPLERGVFPDPRRLHRGAGSRSAGRLARPLDRGRMGL